MHYHVRQLVGGQTHTLATSRWQPTAGQGRRQQHIQENTGNQWAFSLVVCSHSFDWYKPCLNGLQLLQTAGDGRRSFLRAKQTPEHGQPIRTAPPPPPQKKTRFGDADTRDDMDDDGMSHEKITSSGCTLLPLRTDGLCRRSQNMDPAYV